MRGGTSTSTQLSYLGRKKTGASEGASQSGALGSRSYQGADLLLIHNTPVVTALSWHMGDLGFNHSFA